MRILHIDARITSFPPMPGEAILRSGHRSTTLHVESTPMQTHHPSSLQATPRTKPRKAPDLRIDAGTGLAVILGMLVMIQLIARG